MSPATGLVFQVHFLTWQQGLFLRPSSLVIDLSGDGIMLLARLWTCAAAAALLSARSVF